MNKSKWGIIGSGKIARRFATDLKLAAEAELTCVASRSPDSARKFSEEYKIKFFSSIDDLLASDIDIVYVATPHSSHREHSLSAINAGKAVLCEKPFTLNLKEAEDVFSQAKAKKIFVMEAMWTRFFPVIQDVIKKIQTGVIGRVQMIESSFGYQSVFDPNSRIFNPSLGGGSILDVGVYSIAFAQMILNENPVSINVTPVISPTGVDESAAWSMTYPSGAIALGASSVTRVLGNEAIISGEKGEIRIPRFWSPHEYFINGEAHLMKHDGLGFQFEADEVMRAVRSGAIESPLWTHEQTSNVLRIMDEMRRSF